jgi:glycosyl hydrolase family 76
MSRLRARVGVGTSVVAVILLVLTLSASETYARQLSGTQRRFLGLAESGVAKIHRLWWNKSRSWFDAELHSNRVATLWELVPLFEALDGIAIADPTNRHKSNVVGFARYAEAFLDRSLQPVPGFAPVPGEQGGHTAWFDDNGWWGLAFLDAYEATGRRRYIGDAETAFRFICRSGWDSSPGSPGGLWWNTQHTFFAGETLAGGTELGARLYAITHKPQFLAEAHKFIDWGNAWLWDSADGLYARLRTPEGEIPPGGVQPETTAESIRIPASEAAKLGAAPGVDASASAATASTLPSFDSTPLPYVQGPMIVADQTLCEATGIQGYCARAEKLARDAAKRFPELTMGPQYDNVYVHDLLELYAQDGRHEWYRIAKENAQRAYANARERNDLFLRAWTGQSSDTVGSPPGSIQLQAATVNVFAWMAAIR